MQNHDETRELEQYFERFGFCARQIPEEPHPELGIAVVIPSYNEPALETALAALWNCERPDGAVEVIVVINSAENAPESIKQQNLVSERSAREFSARYRDERFRFHVLHFPNLPPKRAGVGLARKIGMDEALRRNPRGLLVCFDADCTCDANYLRAIESWFSNHPKAPGASIYFEHPLAGPEDSRIYDAVIRYELHLRCYVEALRWSGFPHAFHTIGSSMSVRAPVYREQGGMNKRQAGEDFYFLHKIIPLGSFGEISDTRVIASPRPSDRVPFGTGKAVREVLESGRFETYPLEGFRDLREFIFKVPEFFRAEPASLPGTIEEFLRARNFAPALAGIRENCATAESFRRRFFRWFDGFAAMKFIHYARDHHYGSGDLIACATKLANQRGIEVSGKSAGELLLSFRQWQRAGRS